jgi:signal transduction histidine kinase
LLGSKNALERYAVNRQLANQFYYTDPVEAARYANEALQIALELNDKEKRAESYQLTGSCKSRTGDYPAALKDLKLALEAYKKFNDEKTVAYINDDIAGVNASLKRYDEALKIYTELLSYYYNKKIMNKYCSILNNMGTLLLEKEEYANALQKFIKVTEIYPQTKLNDKGFMAIIYCNMGEAYYGLKDYASSFKYRKLSFDLFKELKNTDGIANLQMDISMSLMKLKDYGAAKSYLENAFKNYQSINFAEGVRNAKEKFVLFYKEIHEYNKALAECKGLESLCLSSKDSTMLAKCYGMFADIYLTLREDKLSATYFKKYINLKDALDSKENRQRIAELQALFETEEKEFENKTLRQENDLQKERLNAKENLLLAVSAGIILAAFLLFWLYRKEIKIKKINETIRLKNLELEEHIISKDKFFSILAHNLKNPFWAILAQNELLDKNYDDFNDYERKELIANIGGSAVTVYQLFEDLLKWAKSQQDGIKLNEQSIEIDELIKTAVKPYESLTRKKNITLEILNDGRHTVKGDKFMLETVVGNLLDNAIKYSNQNGKIIIRIKPLGNKTEISISDFGIGMPKEKISKLFKIDENISSAGTMNEKGTGFGLLICKEFVDKHNGKIIVESEEGKGTTFNVVLI